MNTRLLLIPTLVLGSLLAAAPAQAAYSVGIGDQSAALFANDAWKDLRLKKVRYLVPWNTAQDPNQLAEVDTYMAAARAARQDVLVHFTARRGCFVDGRYSRAAACRAPSVAAYTRAFRAFKARFRTVKTYGAWNEANHVSQPVYRNPRRAAQYYTALKRNCRGCKVIAGDLLDSSNLASYARTMNRALKGRARLWGLHNYSDVNRFRSKGTTTLLRIVPGEVWLTETGGIVKFLGSNLGATERKAVRAIRYMFTLAGRYDTRRRGLRSKLARLYSYDFGPSRADARFDASLLAPDGSVRRTYTTFKALARRARK